MTDRYEFATERLNGVDVRLSWVKNGVVEPLGYWVVAACEVGEAKRLVETGQFETQDGSTIPTTVERCLSAFAEMRASSPPSERQARAQ